MNPIYGILSAPCSRKARQIYTFADRRLGLYWLQLVLRHLNLAKNALQRRSTSGGERP